MKGHEISEQEWNRIKPLFPPEKKPQGGRLGKSNREMLNAILYWLNTGIPWRDLPERFGPWQSVYSRFRAWTKAGVWKNILTALIEQDSVDETTLMLDNSTIKVHQHASGAKKKGISRGNRAGQERLDHESPCVNGWTWESIHHSRFMVEIEIGVLSKHCLSHFISSEIKSSTPFFTKKLMFLHKIKALYLSNNYKKWFPTDTHPVIRTILRWEQAALHQEHPR